jgi:hypothetical protein
MRDIIVNITLKICNLITKILKFIDRMNKWKKNILLIIICIIAALGPIIWIINIFSNIGYKFLELIVWIVGQS